MSRRRVSCPQMTQQLWDAIKTIRYQRQVPDVDRIAKYMSRVHNLGIGKLHITVYLLLMQNLEFPSSRHKACLSRGRLQIIFILVRGYIFSVVNMLIDFLWKESTKYQFSKPQRLTQFIL